jgi:hypothetical protein
MTNAEFQAMLDKPTKETIEWLARHQEGARRAVGPDDGRQADKAAGAGGGEEREAHTMNPTPIQAEHTPLEEAEWAYGRGGMPAALTAFLSHPEADGAVARALEATEGLSKWDRVRAILEELKKMTDRDWPLSLRG